MYSLYVIFITASQQKFDEGLAALTAAQKDIGLDYVNRTALQRLKTGLEEQGKSFPFTIPSKVNLHDLGCQYEGEKYPLGI